MHSCSGYVKKVGKAPLMRFLLGTLLLLSSLGAARAATGVIYFNRIPSVNSPATLNRANADGSAEQVMPVALPEAYWPSVSRDGSTLLVTSGEPGRPFKISNNVFAIDLASGALAQVTHFEDVVQNGLTLLTNDLGNVTKDENFSSYSIHFPDRKALSPDGSQAVTIDMIVSGGITTTSPRTNTPATSPFELAGGSFRTPAFEVYPVGGNLPLGQYILLGDERTVYNQGGDGVDWHPNRAEVVVSAHSDIPATGNAGIPFAEGTVLAVFTTGGLNPFLRKLTSPTGIWNSYADIFTSYSVSQTQHDYAPAISPDGTRVVYVRHTQRTDTRIRLLPLPALCEIRMIGYDGSGDHLVLRFVEGLWVNQLAWAPDGTEIAFDLAPQIILSGTPVSAGDVTRSEIYTVRPDGSNPQRIILGPASFPAWAPGTEGASTGANGSGVTLRFERGADGRLHLRASGGSSTSPVPVESSGDLLNWVPLGQLQPGAELPIDPEANARFFRVGP